MVFILAFLLRSIGVGYGLPDLFHQDEPIIVNHALAIGITGWNTHFFIIPPFTMYFLFILSGVFYLVSLGLGSIHSTSDFAVSFLRDPSYIYGIGRTALGGLFGASTAFCVWVYSRKFFSPKIALRAALLLTIVPMHVQHSHYIYADIALTLGVTMAFFLLLRISDKPTLSGYLLYGVVLGWAASVKYTALYFAPALLGAEGFGLRSMFSKERRVKIVFSGAACILTFMLFFPYSWLDWPHFWSQVAHQSGAEGFVSPLHHFLYSIVGGSGVLFVVSAAVGVLGLKRIKASYARAGLIFISFYFAVSVLFSQPYARYMLPLMPVLAILSALGLEKIEKFLGGRRIASLFVCLLFLELSVPTLYGDFLFTRKDTRTQCKEWFAKNIPADTVIALDHRFFGPHLNPNKDQIRDKYNALSGSEKDAVKKQRLDHLLKAAEGRIGYQTYLVASDPAATRSEFLFSGPYVKPTNEDLARVGAQYLVVHYFDPAGDPQKILQALAGRLELARSFSPYWDGSRRMSWDPQASTGAPHLPCELLTRRSLGPYIEVYRLHE
jgi:hypothetical protein